MKTLKYYLLSLLIIQIATVPAAVKTPDFFSQNFSSMIGEAPSSGWSSTGTDAKPAGAYADLFGDSDSSFRVLSISEMTIAMANTEFEGEAEADEWLISPEITVTYDQAALLFTACAFANYGNNMGVGMNNFKVLLSEGGTAKEDFTTTLLETGIRGSATVEVTTKKLVASLNGHKGEKIRIAFVVTGHNVGLTGFTDIRMGQYILDATNYTAEVASKGSKVSIDVNIGLKTPVECSYVDAALSINGEEVGTKEFKKTFGSPTSYIPQMQRIIFENALTLDSDEPYLYTLTLTPRFDGAIPSVVSGSVSTPGSTYPNNVLLEELTATGCGWCTRGTGSIEYYLSKYPGSETEGKVIPIAIHGYMNYFDPMSTGVEEYLEAVEALNESSGLPTAIFNRVTRGLDPSYAPEVQKQIKQRSYNTAKITGAALDETSGTLKVDFNIRNGYTSSARPLNASVALVENNVKGSESGYMQTNYLSRFTANQLGEAYGAELMPYLQPYSADGEYGTSVIAASKMTYQHVARGIYPDFEGIMTDHVWESDVPKDFSLSFDIPTNVMDINNTEIILIVTDPADNSVVASDILPAKDFSMSDVNAVNADSKVSVRSNGNKIEIFAEIPSVARIWNVAGILIDESSVDTSSPLLLQLLTEGIYVVEIRNDYGISTYKLMLK